MTEAALPWWIIIEHEVCRATGTSLYDVRQLPALDVLRHCRAARQYAAADKSWQLRVRMFRDMKRGQQSAMLSELQRDSANGRLLSAWDQCRTDDERLRLIGVNINCHGKRWMRDHPKQLTWLRQHGYTPQDACLADERWTQQYRAGKQQRRAQGVGQSVGATSRPE